MGNFAKNTLCMAACIGGVFLCVSMNAQAQDESFITVDSQKTAAEVKAFWTPERMASAVPLPLPTVMMPVGAEDLTVISNEKILQVQGEPTLVPGWSPQSGLPQPDPTAGYTISPDDPLYELAKYGVDYQAYSTAPTNPDTGPYGPFQRWAHYQNYTKQATATIGKLFFTVPGGGTASCSASVIGVRAIATAAHCLHQGGSGGVWYGDWLFCPSYYKGSGSGAPYPTRGCWSWSAAKVSTAWVTDGATDRDYACIATDVVGDTVAAKVGNVTGWTGRAYNFASSMPMVSWGYPAGAPFNGYNINLATGPEWYEVNMTVGDGQVSKYMGNDMTGGSSGGPWWMSVSHWAAGAEIADTDGYSSTDPPGSAGVPGGPYLNGVNSHRRCAGGTCASPPTSTTGVYWQEMGSSQFRNTVGDTDESEDIMQYCLGYN